jgi:sec-independent protein translocase protein TatC
LNLNLQQGLPVLEKSLAFFRPHHLELRKRTIRIIIGIALCSGICWIFSEELAKACVTPLLNASPLVHRLVYTSLPEAFIAYLKVALLGGIVLSMPMTIYQLWAFISPGLKENEKKITIIIGILSTLLFAFGALFAFFVVLPMLLHYFMSYASEGLQPLPKLGDYFSFVARMVLTCGIAFEIPFLMVMADRTSLFSVESFQKARFYMSGVVLFLAFLLTAGDFMATALLALPLYGLFEAGIVACRVFNRKKKPETH